VGRRCLELRSTERAFIGILASQADAVMRAMSKHFQQVKLSAEEDGWVLITGKRR
jgi:ribosomal protein L11 methylase PrmA